MRIRSAASLRDSMRSRLPFPGLKSGANRPCPSGTYSSGTYSSATYSSGTNASGHTPRDKRFRGNLFGMDFFFRPGRSSVAKRRGQIAPDFNPGCPHLPTSIESRRDDVYSGIWDYCQGRCPTAAIATRSLSGAESKANGLIERSALILCQCRGCCSPRWT